MKNITFFLRVKKDSSKLFRLVNLINILSPVTSHNPRELKDILMKIRKGEEAEICFLNESGFASNRTEIEESGLEIISIQYPEFLSSDQESDIEDIISSISDYILDESGLLVHLPSKSIIIVEEEGAWSKIVKAIREN